MIFWANVFLPYPVLLQHNSGGLAVTVSTAVAEQKVVGKKRAELRVDGKKGGMS